MGISTERFTCDGTQIGFKVNMKGNGYLKTRNGADRLFTNLDFAKAIAYNNGASSARDFDIDLYIFGSIINLDYIQKTGYAKYEFFADNERNEYVRYVIDEAFVTEYNNFGYICFDEGDQQRTDREVGIKRSRVLGRILLDSIDKLSTKYGTVSEVLQYDKGITIKFWKTTATLDIMTNSGLMDLNQWRKQIESEDPEYCRCFPFVKTMDKFVTFYTFISKELYEPNKKHSNSGVALSFRNLLVEDLADNWVVYNKNPNKKCKSIPTFHPVFYKLNNKILSN